MLVLMMVSLVEMLLNDVDFVWVLDVIFGSDVMV